MQRSKRDQGMDHGQTLSHPLMRAHCRQFTVRDWFFEPGKPAVSAIGCPQSKILHQPQIAIYAPAANRQMLAVWRG
jgi:hypothetical protein